MGGHGMSIGGRACMGGGVCVHSWTGNAYKSGGVCAHWGVARLWLVVRSVHGQSCSLVQQYGCVHEWLCVYACMSGRAWCACVRAMGVRACMGGCACMSKGCACMIAVVCAQVIVRAHWVRT